MRTNAALLMFAMVCSGDTVLREVNRTGMRQKAIAVDAASFTEVHIERLARAELMAKPRVNFTQLSVYGEKGGPPLPKPSHTTFDHWQRLFGSLMQSQYQIAEMVSIGSNAVLRIHDSSGTVRRRVLAGSDPLQMEVDGDRFEILYFAFTAPAAYIEQRVDIYIRTDASLKVERGLELLRRLRPIFPDLEVSILVRNDPWFIYEPTYPFVNPFVENAIPPTPQEYSSGATLKCGRTSGSPFCRLD